MPEAGRRGSRTNAGGCATIMRPGREEPGGGGRLLVREPSARAREFAAERSILRVGNGKWKREAFRRYHFITWCILVGPQILKGRYSVAL
jgi:hypothetical protein